jgi:hypothetical protein
MPAGQPPYLGGGGPAWRIGVGVATGDGGLLLDEPAARGLHSSTFRLNVSTFCGTGGAFRTCLGAV